MFQIYARFFVIEKRCKDTTFFYNFQIFLIFFLFFLSNAPRAAMLRYTTLSGTGGILYPI